MLLLVLAVMAHSELEQLQASLAVALPVAGAKHCTVEWWGV